MKLTKMKKLVSVIIPDYNAEKYLSECNESILKQTYTNFELILINDGTTDESGHICDTYRAKDERVIVNHQKNQGVSLSRNKGIHIATGDFIQFVDADDTIEYQMIEKLIQSFNKETDLVISGFKKISQRNNKKHISEHLPKLIGKHSLENFLINFPEEFKNNIINSPCNKLYNNNIMKNNNIYFQNDISNGEDLIFNLTYISECNYVFLLNESLYNYNFLHNSTSLTKGYKGDYFNNRKIVYNHLESFLYSNGVKKEIRSNFLNDVFMRYLKSSINNIFKQNANLTKKERKERLLLIMNDEFVVEKLQKINTKSFPEKLMKILINHKKVNAYMWLIKLRRLF